jgi:hypothetical protein
LRTLRKVCNKAGDLGRGVVQLARAVRLGPRALADH